LIAKTGTPVPANSRRAVRIVPSPPSTTARSVPATRSGASPVPGTTPNFPASAAGRRTSTSSSAASSAMRRRAPSVSAGLVCVKTVIARGLPVTVPLF
jgi:hypothetical protein